jgi:hypothetical protein
LLGEEGHQSGLRVRGIKAGIELLEGEKRLDEPAVRENPAIGDGGEETMLAVVAGDRLRIEGVDVGVAGVLRVEGEDGSQTMSGIDVPIELRLGVDALVDADVVGTGERRSANGVVAVVERLEEKQFPAKERTGKGEMRGETLEAVDMVINPAETGDGILEEPLPFIAATAGGDFDDAAGKGAKFGREGIGEYTHGFDGGGGKTKSGLAGEGIADGGVVDERGGLIGVAALDADKAIGTAENTGEERKCFLEIVVEADKRFERGGSEDLSATGTGSGVNAGRIGGDSDGFGLFLWNELKIDDGGSIRFEGDSFCDGCKACEGDRKFVIARKDADKGVLPEVVGHGGEFPAGGKVFKRDAGVGPEGLDVICIDGKNVAGEAGGVGKRGYGESHKEEEEPQEFCGNTERCAGSYGSAWRAHEEQRTAVRWEERRGRCTG